MGWSYSKKQREREAQDCGCNCAWLAMHTVNVLIQEHVHTLLMRHWWSEHLYIFLHVMLCVVSSVFTVKMIYVFNSHWWNDGNSIDLGLWSVLHRLTNGKKVTVLSFWGQKGSQGMLTSWWSPIWQPKNRYPCFHLPNKPLLFRRWKSKYC